MYTDEDLGYLAGSDLAENAVKDKKLLIVQYNFLVENVPDFGTEFTLTEFLETKLAVKSRLFHWQKQG